MERNRNKNIQNHNKNIHKKYYKKDGVKMDSLHQIVRKYLDENGISVQFFIKYVGCSQPTGSLWLKGQRKLKPEQLEKVHEFLSGKYFKKVEDILHENEKE